MQPEKLIRMANQIATFFRSQASANGAPDAAQATADHIRQFWEPRMRAQLISLCSDGAKSGITGPATVIDPIVVEAAAVLGNPDAAGHG